MATPSKKGQVDVTYLSATPNVKKPSPVRALGAPVPTTTTLTRRRSLSDYRTTNANNKDINPGKNGSITNSAKSGLIGLKKLLPEKLVSTIHLSILINHIY